MKPAIQAPKEYERYKHTMIGSQPEQSQANFGTKKSLLIPMPLPSSHPPESFAREVETE